ncbi:hypothetical protein OS493_024018 [Desmophyllum pertusum]|uniref:Uncharacterized protein n=1 Tax=Desmophyllum pertusum TaxID=174260 RepID=A0A9W9ZLQ9_9CNID|nr:hypothetical protein OS493_024018 [Desmophyllum pertusum]
MSDRPPLEACLKWKIRIESPSLSYAAKAVTRNVILAVDIPYPLLKAWHEFIASQKKERRQNAKTLDGGEGPSCSKSTYEQIRGEVDESLRVIASRVHALYGKTKGSRKKEELNSNNKRFHIFEGQILSVLDLKRDNNLMKDEIAEWKQSYANLKEEMEKLYQEMLLAVQEREE